MPAGVSWGEYLKFLSCALVTMFAGSQAVHLYYKPLKDLNAYIREELKKDPSIDPKLILQSLENENNKT
ncbi:ubiquinol-cytochrome-c reductase complex assembly factor 6 [Condylostylus longicornis]|uniref:ubiquinol-cytochrome-c reductase complex assembly factor 6 n=1 Tax=Condylostylus longicornis TaxID=2530218 RepID=UPI00244E0919|nr:ubiquinol-cytochrome-c reductase complex assembly factor 6 [Condylostylus longicornis]